MDTKNEMGVLESRVGILETRVAALEQLSRNAKRTNRRKKEYTPEEKAAIRARLLAGQEAARKRREGVETKIIDKPEPEKTKKSKNKTDSANQ
jgi:hypothetical protein